MAVAFLLYGLTMDLESACRPIDSHRLALLGTSGESVFRKFSERTLWGSALVRLLQIDAAVQGFETVFESAGRRGLEIELAPADLVLLTGGVFAEVSW